MELLEGEGLDVRLERERLGIEAAVQICLDVLEPLGFLHERGLVHRDLKPSNIFLTPLGPKLLDFGLARPVEGPEDTRLTKTGTILGTPHYMAPEQWRAKDVGPQSDLFSCGAILYEMLTGRYAFPGDDAIAVFHACAYEQPPPLTGAAGIEGIDAVVRLAIAKTPAERPGSADAMGTALRAALTRLRALQSPGVAGTPPAERPAEMIQRFIALPFRMLRPDPEVDFLATSLPEAIGATLAGLEHLVVRSTRLAQSSDGNQPDLKQLASELEVDYALAGNLVCAGERVRLSAELLEVPAGTVVWSLQEDVPIGDLFQLQDHLARKVVEGVAIPLSPHDEEQLSCDVCASPRGYEFYLRALHAAGAVKSGVDLLAIRDLLRACIEEDPNFVPAVAQYGRVCRVIAKYYVEDLEEHLRLGKEAFERALELSPESPIVHHLYTYYQLEELADAKGAMLRLLERIGAAAPDAELWAGLVPACRFLGLYEASIAAHERARALDSKIQTSVEFTYMSVSDFDRALEVAPPPAHLLAAMAMSVRGDEAGAITLLEDALEQEFQPLRDVYVGAPLAALTGRSDEAEHKLRRIFERGVRDPESIFIFARTAARAGAVDLALDMIEDIAERGLNAVGPLKLDPWFETLRREPRFQAALARAEEGRRAASVVFHEAGGRRLLGVDESVD